MFRSLPFFLATIRLTCALTPAQNGDVFITQKVLVTRYVCPCDDIAPTGSDTQSSFYSTLFSSSNSPYTTSSTNNNTLTTTLSGFNRSSTVTTVSSGSSSGTTTTVSGSSISSASAVPSFYFASYGNGFVTDGTSLGDDTSVEYAALNNGYTAFVVNSTGALIDPANGRVAVVDRSATNPVISFVSQVEFDSQNPSAYVACDCSVSLSFLSCSCNGLTAFAAGADTYLHIQASSLVKRGGLAPRQSSANSAVSMSATPVPSSNSTSVSSTTSTSSASSCTSPRQTFVVVAEGSALGTQLNGKLLTGTRNGGGQPYLAQFVNNSDPRLYYRDACTSFLHQIVDDRVLTSTNSSGRYANLIWDYANTTDYIPCNTTVSDNNVLNLDCYGGYNKTETDSNGDFQVANVVPDPNVGGYTVTPIVSYTTAVPTFPTYTTSSCPSPTPTFNVISNGSTYSNRVPNNGAAYGTFMLPDIHDANTTYGIFNDQYVLFPNGTAPGVYTIDPCTGVWTERSTGTNQILVSLNYDTYDIMRWINPSTVRPNYNWKVCNCNIAQTTNYINCDCGFGRSLYEIIDYPGTISIYKPGDTVPNEAYLQPIAQALNATTSATTSAATSTST